MGVKIRYRAVSYVEIHTNSIQPNLHVASVDPPIGVSPDPHYMYQS